MMARPLPTVRNGGKTIAHHPHLHQTFRSHKATAYGQPRRVDGGVATTLWQGPAKGLINGFKWQGDEVAALRSRNRTVQRYDGAAKSTTPKPTPDDYLGTRCPHRTHCLKPCEVKLRPAYKSSCRRCSMQPCRCGRHTGMCVGVDYEGLHKRFGKILADTHAAADRVAEMSRQLGGEPIATVTAQPGVIQPTGGSAAAGNAQAYVAQVAGILSRLLAGLRNDIAASALDPLAQNLLIEIATTMQAHLWTVESSRSS